MDKTDSVDEEEMCEVAFEVAFNKFFESCTADSHRRRKFKPIFGIDEDESIDCSRLLADGPQEDRKWVFCRALHLFDESENFAAATKQAYDEAEEGETTSS